MQLTSTVELRLAIAGSPLIRFLAQDNYSSKKTLLSKPNPQISVVSQYSTISNQSFRQECLRGGGPKGMGDLGVLP